VKPAKVWPSKRSGSVAPTETVTKCKSVNSHGLVCKLAPVPVADIGAAHRPVTAPEVAVSSKCVARLHWINSAAERQLWSICSGPATKARPLHS